MVAPGTLKEVRSPGNGFYSSYTTTYTFPESAPQELELHYIKDEPTAYTLPANTYAMFVDAGWRNSCKKSGFRPDGTSNIIYFNDNTGSKTYSLTAGSYTSQHFLSSNDNGTPGHSINNFKISSTATEYIKVRIKLSDIIDEFNEDGTFTSSDSTVIKIASTDPKKGGSIIFESGGVVTAPIPDSNGYVEFYVDKSTRKYAYSYIFFHYNANNSEVQGNNVRSLNAYQVKNLTVQAESAPTQGTTLMNIPAGKYTIKFDYMSSKYVKPDGKSITVTESNGIQYLKIVLHSHSYSSEYKSDSTGHWYECSCGNKMTFGYHRSSGAATENKSKNTVMIWVIIGIVLGTSMLVLIWFILSRRKKEDNY